MNFVLASVIFAVILATVGRPVWPAVVGRVADDGPAAAAGLQPGDVVTAVDGRPIAYWEDLDRAIATSQAEPPADDHAGRGPAGGRDRAEANRHA